MEVWFTAKPSRSKAQQKSTERALAGRRYEKLSRIHCWKKNYKVIGLNLRLGHLEIDCLARDRRGYQVVIEVRGRADPKFAPTHYLSRKKKQTLERVLQILAARGKKVRGEFVEIVGPLPNSPIKFAWVCLKLFLGLPTSLQIRTFEL